MKITESGSESIYMGYLYEQGCKSAVGQFVRYTCVSVLTMPQNLKDVILAIS